MSEQKIFVYSTDSAIAIVEGVYNYQDSTIKVLSKKNYLKSKFFENHSKILEHLFSNSTGYQGAVEEISDYSFLFFYHTSVPQDIPVYQPSFQEQWESKQAQLRNSVEPIFGGAITNRGIKDIFL